MTLIYRFYFISCGMKVNVTGLMYYWGLTIDVVSAIVLVIGVGLSVDYASHFGHSFLVQAGSSTGNIVKLLAKIIPLNV